MTSTLDGPRSIIDGAIVGTFVCGDGTLCGQLPASAPVFANAPVLTLAGGAFTLPTTVEVTFGRALLALQARPFTLRIDQTPQFAVTLAQVPRLDLLSLGIKRAQEVATFPSEPETVILTPTAPPRDGLLVPAAATEDVLLVPTVPAAM